MKTLHLSLLLVVCGMFSGTSTLVSTAAEPGSSEAARRVDELLASEVFTEDSSGEPVGRVDDETFLRRAYLDVVGEVPTIDEVLAFTLDPDADKRAKLIATLLADDGFGRNWGRYWRDVIMYRRSEDRSLIAAGPLTDFLTEKFNKNTSWDEIATAFVTAKGDVREDGSTALIMAQAGRPEETVAEISRIFMGIQIQCAQCHDHPTDRWKREQFHQLAAFFPRVAVRPQRNGTDRTFLVTATDFFPRFHRRNNNNRYIGTREHRMPDLDNPGAEGELMQPVFFATGQKLDTGAKDVQRRDALARWMTSRSNPWFAKAYVNRIWAELVGEGFYDPIDDIGPDRSCSAPETLKYLAGQFVESGYDTKWLFATIMSTGAYQRESRSRRNFDETPFLANCAQRLRGDQLYSNLAAVLNLPENNASVRGRYGAARGPRALFNIAFGYDPSSPRGEISGSIPQALAMMNNRLINQAISAYRPDGLGGLLRQIEDDEDALVQLYLRALARQPTDKELRTCLGYIREIGNRAEAFEDILWALVNSTEFLHRK